MADVVINIKELDDVLIKDVGNHIQSSGKYVHTHMTLIDIPYYSPTAHCYSSKSPNLYLKTSLYYLVREGVGLDIPLPLFVHPFK